MKQLVQNLSNGLIEVREVPSPLLEPGTVLIQSKRSLISAGTERMLADFAKSNLLQKAIKQPDKVKDVLSKIKTDGIYPTYEAVNSKLSEPMPLGYCNAGIVLESSVPEFKSGDRVVSNGPHSEVIRVERNLCAKIPDEVDFDTAAFTVLGSVALQSVRLANPTLGENFVVFGLGSIGLLTVQILLANGCNVVAVDLDDDRLKLAKKFGAKVINSLNEDIENVNEIFSHSGGADGVIIAASSDSHEIIQQAAQVCRTRGRVVLVGVVGLNLRREDFYEKEITFQVSSSYGPGRYDKSYESDGIDYPIGFVRWTENRNFQAVLQLMKSNSIDIGPLITSKFNFDKATEAYELLLKGKEIGSLIEYGEEAKLSQTLFKTKTDFSTTEKVSVGVIGSGNFSSRVLIPLLNKLPVNKHTIASSTGLSASENAKKYSFSYASSSPEDIILNKDINTVFITTRHNLHARDVVKCLAQKKNVFVEKPLAMNKNELRNIKEAYDKVNSGHRENIRLMVGFNRRFSPHIEKIKEELVKFPSRISSVVTINAGFLEKDHWTNNLKIGGGRILGEACHFIDLLTYLHDSEVESYFFHSLDEEKDSSIQTTTISLKMRNGTLGTIHYFANGGKSYPKERIEIFKDSSTIVLDNFRLTKGFDLSGFKKFKTFSQDKGHSKCVTAFIDSVKEGKPSPIPFKELYHSSLMSIEIAEAIEKIVTTD